MYCLLRSCFQRCIHFIRKIKLKYVCICIGLIALLDFFGVFTHMFEITYDSNFVYPYEGDIHEFVHALRHNEKPVVDPINDYNFSFLLDNQEKCIETPHNTFRVVYIVKSAIENFERRSAIRNSWGFEKRFFDVPSKTIFMLGVSPSDELQAKVKIEATKYKDIIQANFIDTYYNNTIKTMMSFKWLIRRCSNSKFYMFVDDDIYVSVKNVLRFIRNPTNYPSYLKEPKKFEAHKREIKDTDIKKEPCINDTIMQRNIHMLNTEDVPVYKNLKENFTAEEIFHGSEEKSLSNSLHAVSSIIMNSTEKYRDSNKTLNSVQNETMRDELLLNRVKRQIFDFELPGDVRLFAGFVFVSSPHRHKSSKWYVPLREYPYHLWPPYVTAGAYILSKEALLDMYYASLYTKHFRFDDIYLGLVAKKANIEPFHCEEFHFYKKDYTKFNYKYVVTSHGYGNPSELLNVWNEQKTLGNA